MQNTVSKQRLDSLKKVVSNNSIVLVVIAMIIAGTIAEGSQFLSFQNFMNILRNHAVIGIIALGMSFVIISGNIDLSVGAQMVVLQPSRSRSSTIPATWCWDLSLGSWQAVPCPRSQAS